MLAAQARAPVTHFELALRLPQLLEEYCQFIRLLSEPSRLQLLCQLRKRAMDVAALIEASGFSQSHISRQLGQLQRAGLVRCEASGCEPGSSYVWRSSWPSCSQPERADRFCTRPSKNDHPQA
jgi:hypothetical protein